MDPIDVGCPLNIVEANALALAIAEVRLVRQASAVVADAEESGRSCAKRCHKQRAGHDVYVETRIAN